MLSYIISLSLFTAIVICLSFILHDFKQKPKEEAKGNVWFYLTLASGFLFFFLITLEPTIDYVSDHLRDKNIVELEEEMVLEEPTDKPAVEEKMKQAEESSVKVAATEDKQDEKVEIVTKNGEIAKVSKEELDSINKLIDDINNIEGNTRKTPKVEVVSADIVNESPESTGESKSVKNNEQVIKQESPEIKTEENKPSKEEKPNTDKDDKDQKIDFGEIEELEVIGVEVID